jgi:hypothetical protein
MIAEKEEYIVKKQIRRENKRTDKRKATADEVIFIFEKILDNWKTIKIYNTIIQLNRNSCVDKKWVEKISTGNSKLYASELSKEKFNYYLELRDKVYEYHLQNKIPL